MVFGWLKWVDFQAEKRRTDRSNLMMRCVSAEIRNGVIRHCCWKWKVSVSSARLETVSTTSFLCLIPLTTSLPLSLVDSHQYSPKADEVSPCRFAVVFRFNKKSSLTFFIRFLFIIYQESKKRGQCDNAEDWGKYVKELYSTREGKRHCSFRLEPAGF